MIDYIVLFNHILLFDIIDSSSTKCKYRVTPPSQISIPLLEFVAGYSPDRFISSVDQMTRPRNQIRNV